MMEQWNSEFFVERLKVGDFDEHILDTIGRLSTQENTEVAEVLIEQDELLKRVH